MRCTFRLLGFISTYVLLGSMCRASLPAGSAPQPLPLPHFPDRLHAFIWRNWNVVPTVRVAKVLGTSVENVRRVAGSMGLPNEEPVSADREARQYLSVIRRNWHLLPYDQLLTLLDWPEERLAFALQEDDFLWIKLGQLKPKCERLTWAEPDPEAVRRAEEVRQVVEAAFPKSPLGSVEQPFAFLERFRSAPNPSTQTAPAREDRSAQVLRDPPRFLYSYFAVYGDPLSDPSLDPYPDTLLRELADRGVNGVWLHVVLRQLATSPQFPEFGEGREARLENLRRLVARAARFGVGVYLYCNEPRSMPPEFFKTRPDLAGVSEGDAVAMCTSQPAVRQWLSDSLASVFSQVPGLAGVFTITASENLTNCASHSNWKQCPHCKDRSVAEIITEVNAAIEAGVHRGNPKARVLVWDWCWPDASAPDIIRALPKSVWFMSVSEWSLPLARGGVQTAVGEYSISAVGPGPRATQHWKLAGEAGLKRAAKVQINNTWELSAVPYLPVLDLVAEHASRLAHADVDGMMLSWSLGGYPSPNLDVVNRFRVRPAPTTQQVLDAVAQTRFGDASPIARSAWSMFSKAFAAYPFDVGVLYKCPVQFGPANLLCAQPTGYYATMLGFPYDDLTRWRGPYPPDVFLGQFEKLSGEWEAGVRELDRAVELTPATLRPAAESDLCLARAAGLHFRSVANQSRFVIARDALRAANLEPARRRELTTQIRRSVEDEIAVAKALIPLARRDSRIGFEASNHYYYFPQDLMEKVLNARETLSHFPLAE